MALLAKGISLKLGRTLYRNWMTLALLFTVLYLYYVLSFLRNGDEDTEENDDDNNDDATMEQLCIRPPLELMPEGFQQHFKPVPKIVCRVEKNPVSVHNGVASLAHGAAMYYGTKLKCLMSPLYRETDFMTRVDSGDTKQVWARVKAKSDFVKVDCRISEHGAPMYSNVHSTIVMKPGLSEKAKFPAGGLKLNVMIFGFDSVSRLTWLRNLPKTHEWFTNKMGGVVMEGYNIVGDGTPQALFPILVGKSEPEVPEMRRGYSGAKPLDDLPWIWKAFSKAGYATQWGEDGAAYGTFQYRMLGFKDQPVDHYMRPFYLFAEETLGQHQPYCFGDTTRHVNMMQWGRQFMEVYKHRPRFSFLFHSELSHDQSNKLQVADDDLVEYLDRLREDGYLDNTLLILMSDHGFRYDFIRNTVQGKFEERLPYMGIYLPEVLRKRYPEAYANLRSNANKLTSPFDVHELLRDVLNFDENWLFEPTNEDDRGVSLLRDISLSRTCKQAGIEPHWCSCLRWVSLDANDDSLHSITWSILHHLNELTRDHRDQCEELRFGKVIRAEIFAPESSLLQFKGSKDDDGRLPDFGHQELTTEVLYQVTLLTLPNNGLYEVTLKLDLVEDMYVVNEDQISRLNRYGDDPKCIMDKLPHLRPYCYCIKKEEVVE